MRPYRPRGWTIWMFLHDLDVIDTRLPRLRAWSGLTGCRFESSSAHRKALQSRAFRIVRATPWPAPRAVATLVATSARLPRPKRGGCSIREFGRARQPSSPDTECCLAPRGGVSSCAPARRPEGESAQRSRKRLPSRRRRKQVPGVPDPFRGRAVLAPGSPLYTAKLKTWVAAVWRRSATSCDRCGS